MKTNRDFSSMIELLCCRAEQNPDGVAFELLHADASGGQEISYSVLERKARAVAATLAQTCKPGDRALMFYPSGVDFIAAFLGCMYAGVIGVPLYPPRRNQHVDRIVAVMKNCTPTAILTTSTSGKLSALFELEGIERLKVIETDLIVDGIETLYRPRAMADLAFLQYTSGSTGQPKGVMVSHANLLHNLASMHREFGYDQSSRMVSWLPVHHDLGLIFGVLLPLFGGFPASLLPSSAFIQRPYRWLESITKTGATTTGGPNFAFDLCVDHISEQEKKSLDLSRLTSVLNGAEPVRAATLQRFAEYFADCGFRAGAFNPCYGMAESTLVISMNGVGKPVQIDHIVPAKLDQHVVEHAEKDGYAVVGCGQGFSDQTLMVVSPESGRVCQPHQIGEVWVAGPSIATGYWNNPLQSEEAFAAQIEGGDGTRFLRTGDLAYSRDGLLFITGRLKDLIIIRGRNHYPQDIEHTVSACWNGFRPGRCAAFSVDQHGAETLVVVQEVERVVRDKVNVAELGPLAVSAVSTHHELMLSRLILVRPGTIPVTSSGKIQRRLVKQMLSEGTLSVVGEWSGPVQPAPSRGTDAAGGGLTGAGRPSTLRDIEHWLKEDLAKYLKVPVDVVPVDRTFIQFGLDSFVATSVAGSMGRRLGMEIEANLLYDFPTVRGAARHLAGQLGLIPIQQDTFQLINKSGVMLDLDRIERMSEDEALKLLEEME